ncbi:MAG: cyclic lactone autoinducer peptide [Lachnospiraceae bacterium]|nr:cyclic lactone autoinducer peptide [Lachnospiraceae bacterium]
MKLLLKRYKDFGRILPALAFFLAVSSVTSTCFFMAHQPDVPNGLQKFEK